MLVQSFVTLALVGLATRLLCVCGSLERSRARHAVHTCRKWLHGCISCKYYFFLSSCCLWLASAATHDRAAVSDVPAVEQLLQHTCVPFGPHSNMHACEWLYLFPGP